MLRQYRPSRGDVRAMSYMTALYSEAGNADGYVEMLVDQPEAYDLLQARIAYRRDDIIPSRFIIRAHWKNSEKVHHVHGTCVQHEQNDGLSLLESKRAPLIGCSLLFRFFLLNLFDSPHHERNVGSNRQ